MLPWLKSTPMWLLRRRAHKTLSTIPNLPLLVARMGNAGEEDFHTPTGGWLRVSMITVMGGRHLLFLLRESNGANVSLSVRVIDHDVNITLHEGPSPMLPQERVAQILDTIAQFCAFCTAPAHQRRGFASVDDIPTAATTPGAHLRVVHSR